MLPIIPILILLTYVFGAVALWFWLSAVIEVARVVLTIIAIPFLFKLFADFIAHYKLKMNKTASTILGIAFAFLVAAVLYINFWALFIGTAILGIIYMIGPRLITDVATSNALSLTKWFKRRK